MEPVDQPPRTTEDDLADALPAALERASLLEWRLEQVTLREKDLWLRLETERTAVADAQERVADLTARMQKAEESLAEARRANAALTARLVQTENQSSAAPPRAEREAVALARAWRRAEHRANQQTAALEEAHERLEVLEHAQVRFHARLTEWQRQVATDRQDVDLAEFIAELRAEVLRLGQANAALKHQLRAAPSEIDRAPITPAASESGSDKPEHPTSSATLAARLRHALGPADPTSPGKPAEHDGLAPTALPDRSPPGPAKDEASQIGLPSVPSSALDGLWSSDPADRQVALVAAQSLRGARGREALVATLPLATTSEEQIQLLNQLARLGGIDDETPLQPLLQSVEPMVRAAAIDVARRTETVARATDDGNPYVRRRALMRYLQVDAMAARPRLAQAIHDEDPGVRRTACAALAGHDHPSGVQALLTAADDPDVGVRAAAVRALPSDVRGRLPDAVCGNPALRRTVLNAIRAERRAQVARESSPHGR